MSKVSIWQSFKMPYENETLRSLIVLITLHMQTNISFTSMYDPNKFIWIGLQINKVRDCDIEPKYELEIVKYYTEISPFQNTQFVSPDCLVLHYRVAISLPYLISALYILSFTRTYPIHE